MLYNVCTITTIYSARQRFAYAPAARGRRLRSTINLLISRPIIPAMITETTVVSHLRDEDLVYVVVKR